MDAIEKAKQCRLCEADLPLGARPVFVVHPKAKIAIIGQAPGRKVHETGIPWNDASGKRLRSWLGVTDEQFYDATNFAQLPMGFCFPGTGKSGDLPPRPECAPTWHEPLLAMMPNIKITLLFGQYAQARYLGAARKPTLTETVQQWESYLPKFLPMPHPSPRNQRWFKRNPWFEEDVLTFLQDTVRETLKR